MQFRSRDRLDRTTVTRGHTMRDAHGPLTAQVTRVGQPAFDPLRALQELVIALAPGPPSPCRLRGVLASAELLSSSDG